VNNNVEQEKTKGITTPSKEHQAKNVKQKNQAISINY
jgi:hypothetical protein